MNLFFERLQQLAAPPPFNVEYRAFPVACTTKTPAAQLAIEQGDKIILPASALDHLAKLKVTYPMMFEVTNATTNRRSHCGVLEFSADEGIAYLPYWMMENLLLESGSILRVRNVTLPKGSFVQLQPHLTRFTELANPRVVLEKALRSFSCLTRGDTIAIRYGDTNYLLDITEVKPGTAISIYETDVNVDFKEPRDYKEYSKKQAEKKAASGAAAGSAAAPAGDEKKAANGQSAAQKAASAVLRKATGADDAGGGWGADSSEVISHSSSAASPPNSNNSHVSFSASGGAASPAAASAAQRAAKANGTASPSSTSSSSSSASSASGGSSNYFAQFKEGYRLKPVKGAATTATPAAATPAAAASGGAAASSSSSGAAAAASPSDAAAVVVDGSNLIVKRVGAYEYTYQKIDGKEKLLRRRPISAAANRPASAAGGARASGSGASFVAFSGAGNKLK